MLPELGSIKLFDGSSPKNKITLRMLMSHTAGFGYTFFHPEVKAWCESKGGDEFDGKWAMLQSPLLAEPGTDWNYGSNMDWAGKMLEKVSGQTLGEYCRQHIFEPLGCKDISFGLLPQCKDRFASLHQSHPDGKMRQIGGSPAAGAQGTLLTLSQIICPSRSMSATSIPAEQDASEPLMSASNTGRRRRQVIS